MVAPPLSFTEIPWKIPHSMGKKLALITSGAIGLPENPPRFWPDQKKTDLMTHLASNFSAAPRGAPIKSYRCTALISTEKMGKTENFVRYIKWSTWEKSGQPLDLNLWRIREVTYFICPKTLTFTKSMELQSPLLILIAGKWRNLRGCISDCCRLGV